MPIFEYRCEDCGRVFEELLGSSDIQTRPTCPSCGSENAARKFSVFAAPSGGKTPVPSCGAGGCGSGSGFS